MNPSNNKNKKRLIFVFACVCVLCMGLALRVGWIQVVAGEYYSNKAIAQQTNDVPIPAKRGVIYDRNGKELAISAVTNTIWVRPGEVKSVGVTEADKAYNIDKTAATLAGILEMEKDDVLESITADRFLIKVAKYVEKEKADEIREHLAQGELKGISIAEDVKRYYPQGAFLAHILGSTNDDNEGLSGIELQYDKYLKGTPGRWVKSVDNGRNNTLSYGVEKYFQAEDGLSVVLTIDEVIQHFTEKAVESVHVSSNAQQVFAIVMDPKTGDVLAMARTPDFDPNNSRVPLDPEEAAYVDELTNDEKLIYWNQMWRNTMISDIYDPGSTFKLLTTAAALEEGVTSPADTFFCSGHYTVAGARLKCWRSYNPHGQQTLTQGVMNSCNPVFIQLAQRMGIETFYDYLDRYGFNEKTGIDFPGEGINNLQPISTAGPVGLATMSYGQGISVTPLSLVTAISSLGNDGMLMQPRLVKELRDSDGNTIQRFEPKEVRQVVSSQTAREMLEIMEAVVSLGSGSNAQVAGYRIGGKTGTANKPENGAYSRDKLYASFVAVAPIDDPQLAILFVVDEPVGVTFGSQVAAPGAQMILEETFRYLNIEPQYTAEELENIEKSQSTVPNVTGRNFEDAVGILGGQKLNYIVSPAQDLVEDFVIVDQYPKAGEKVPVGTSVYIYRE